VWSIDDQSELTTVPLVGYRRAQYLRELGITTIRQLSEVDLSDHRFDSFPLGAFPAGSIHLIKNYAKAIRENRPIIVGSHPFLEVIGDRGVYFFDAEYNPARNVSEPFGIFLIGIMDVQGEVEQHFLNKVEDEKKMLEEFSVWLAKNRPVLISYSSTSADKPQLLNAFKRFSIPTSQLERSFFDLYYDLINTQRPKDQVIFLPMTGHMGLKDVSSYFGYTEPRNLEIRDGQEALIAYKRYLETGSHKIRTELLNYNRCDLERCRFIFKKITSLLSQGKEKA